MSPTSFGFCRCFIEVGVICSVLIGHVYRVIFLKWPVDIYICTVHEIQKRMIINVSKNLFELKGNLEKYVNQIKKRSFHPQNHPLLKKV